MGERYCFAVYCPFAIFEGRQRGCDFIYKFFVVDAMVFLICGVASTSVFVSYRCMWVLLAVLWCVPAYGWSYALGVAACTTQD
jgi:hypothetical protein